MNLCKCKITMSKREESMRDENVGKRRCSLKSECILAFIVSLYEDGLGFRLSFHKAGPIELHVRQPHWASNLSWPQTHYYNSIDSINF